MGDRDVILITGGSRGIGASSARLAAKRGYRIAVNYRSDDANSARFVDQLKATGAEVAAFKADISDPDAVRILFDAAENAFGPVTALVNSAGITEDTPVPVGDQEIDVIDKVVRINVLGTIYPSREAVRRMSTARGGKGGVIVNVSSMASTIGGRDGRRVYAATKGAVDVFTLGLAKEVATEGIRVNAVRPGVILTDMNRQLAKDDSAMAAVEGSIAMGRIGEPDEIAAAIMWLLSDDASFVSGTRLDASGGGFVI